MAPGSLRSFVVGTSYQLGNLVSSASSTIEATIGERFPLPPKGTTKRYKYGMVICIFMGCVYAYVVFITFMGPEYLGRRMDADSDKDFEDVAHTIVKHHDDNGFIEKEITEKSGAGVEKTELSHDVAKV